jgi:hypothetical protein
MRTLCIAAAVVSALVAGVAAAQDPSATATSGGSRQRAGFTPDPITVSIYSGGGIDASNAIGGSCVGMIASAPDYEFTYTAGSYPLTFAVNSRSDTSLIINAPDGRWYCNDDSDGLNPVLRWGSPQSGSYDIWIGAVGEAGSSTLYITENR